MGLALEVRPPATPVNARKENTKVLLLTGHTFEVDDTPGKAELESYVTTGGGTLLVNAASGSEAFDAAFQNWARELFGQDRWVRIPQDDPLMTGAFAPGLANSLAGLSYRRTKDGGAPARLDWPTLYGVKHRDRWVVIYSPYDLVTAISHMPAVNCIGYEPRDADAIVSNILLYAAPDP